MLAGHEGRLRRPAGAPYAGTRSPSNMTRVQGAGRPTGTGLRRALLIVASVLLALLLPVLGPSGCDGTPDWIDPPGPYVELTGRLSALIESEIAAKGIPAFSIALVDGDRIVWARGFGMADAARGRAATAATVYRAGSVSKLFTDIALMQLVEDGQVDLDRPVTDYLPDFRPENPYERPVTLRQLMCHRSGLVREPPVGNYFDPTEPTLEETVASLDSTRIVYAPGTRTKYSNAGLAVVGLVVERLRGKPFADVVKERVLDPVGMERAGFRLGRARRESELARARMWTYDGRTFDAPVFDFGMAPAGNLFSDVIDLGRFVCVLLDRGQASDGSRVLQEGTLEEMWTPQLVGEGESGRFGLGFVVDELQGHRRIGHDGAVYGFSTSLAALPDQKLGVVAVSSLDVTNAVVARIADFALESMLALRSGAPLPEDVTTQPVPAKIATSLEGTWEQAGQTLRLARDGDRLLVDAGTTVLDVRQRGDELVVDDRLSSRGSLEPAEDGQSLRWAGKTWQRQSETGPPAPVQARWRGLIGEYGFDHNVLYVIERDGRLHALIEWFFRYPLQEVGDGVFNFPGYGLYHGEQIIFERDDRGRAIRAIAAGVEFPRRRVGVEEGATFTVRPREPIERLRQRALASAPPPRAPGLRDPELVDLSQVDSGILYDIRYATANNFLGAVLYSEPRALLHRPVAEAVARAHRSLEPHGLGIVVHDAYRPWHVTKLMADATPADLQEFVASPERGSRHNRGCAVDLTLYDLESRAPVRMPSGVDEFSPRARSFYPGGTDRERWHRDLLRRTLRREGLIPARGEWWHFDWPEWSSYAILNRRFEAIPR